MKKKLFLGLLAAAAVSFTACQKDEVLSEVPQDNAIGFSTYVGRDAQTKAAETDKTAMENNTYPGIGVFAYYTKDLTWDNAIATDDKKPTPNFMYNINIKYSTSTTKWGYANTSDTKYWPGGEDKVSFFAYAPYSNSNSPLSFSNNSATGAPTVTYAQPVTVAEQVDLLYATPVKNQSSGTVSFTFNHALARVGLKVKTARTDYQISITSVTLTGKFNTTGTFSLSDGKLDNTTLITASPGQAYSPTCLSTYTNSTDGMEITTSTNNGYMMIIPTDLSADDNKLSVSVNYSYQYKYDGTQLSTAVSTTQTGSVKVNFEQGKAYTLVLTLDPLSPIAFSVDTVTGWDTDINKNSNLTDDDQPVTIS